mmetsp:Transcript_115071/g.330622  ORF Transcript_115071/g.330622 Transcript_115071/m.330622 type:complete len:229 (-) Transcript_115071:127-813(-)
MGKSVATHSEATLPSGKNSMKASTSRPLPSKSILTSSTSRFAFGAWASRARASRTVPANGTPNRRSGIAGVAAPSASADMLGWPASTSRASESCSRCRCRSSRRPGSPPPSPPSAEPCCCSSKAAASTTRSCANSARTSSSRSAASPQPPSGDPSSSASASPAAESAVLRCAPLVSESVASPGLPGIVAAVEAPVGESTPLKPGLNAGPTSADPASRKNLGDLHSCST